ncbi:PepSY-associated TM helix domain-containing protein [Bordetella sp. LUAb4]|uniref:PepSY-associated TM helix domain-containing protein n=1 Tax=Bordetella sp. LUAb4 TaxID=2843195 RepID=UPI001E6095DE|nr:PepSY-associated TM helix domain-containing protein [Bordetella sp. LUAb4]
MNTPSSRRSYWLKTLHQWHWISAALCLVGMLLFALTGLTLNNASLIEAKPRVITRQGELPGDLRETLVRIQAAAASSPGRAATPLTPADVAATGTGNPAANPRRARAAPAHPDLPPALLAWLSQQMDIDASGKVPEWSADEIYVSLPRAGGDGWVSLDLQSGAVESEVTDRGWIAYFNDLHKGRHTGVAWRWFIDACAVACLVFSLTGLLLLKMHAGRRLATWPVVGLGLLVPVLLALLFIH